MQVEAGTDAIYGYSPVAAALQAGRRSVQTLYVQEGSGAALLQLAWRVIHGGSMLCTRVCAMAGIAWLLPR